MRGEGKGELKRTNRVLLCQCAYLIAPKQRNPLRRLKCLPKTVIKPFCIRTDLRTAVARFHRADLVLCGYFQYRGLCAARKKNVHGVHRALSASRSRRKEHDASAFSFAQRAQRRIQRRHCLADSRGCLRKKAFPVPDRHINIGGELPLSFTISFKGKRQRPEGFIAHMNPRKPLRFQLRSRQTETLKLHFQGFGRKYLFIAHQLLALRVDVQHAQCSPS